MAREEKKIKTENNNEGDDDDNEKKETTNTMGRVSRQTNVLNRNKWWRSN